MKPKAYTTLIIVAVLFVMVVKTGTAQDTVPVGVKTGDQFTYSVTGSYSANAPIDDVPAEVLNAQISVFFQITIVNVSSPDIGYTWVWHFVNGTEQTGDGITDIEIPTESEGPFRLIVSANLTTNDSIHPHFGPTSTFNETVMYPYMNYTREANRLHTEAQQANNETSVIKYRTVDSDAYYDKLTGMLFQFEEDTTYQNPSFTTSLSWKLSGTSAWTSASAGSYPPAPFFSIPVIIAIGIVVAIVVVIAGWFVSNKRRNAKRKQLLKKKTR